MIYFQRFELALCCYIVCWYILDVCVCLCFSWEKLYSGNDATWLGRFRLALRTRQLVEGPLVLTAAGLRHPLNIGVGHLCTDTK